MNLWCFLFGCRLTFAYKGAEDGVVREGYREVESVCRRCGTVFERFMAYVGADGEIYEDPEQARQARQEPEGNGG